MVATHGFDPYAGGGFVPNFMAFYQMGGRQLTGAGMAAGLKSGKISPAAATAAGYAKGQSKRKTGPKEHVYPASHLACWVLRERTPVMPRQLLAS